MPPASPPFDHASAMARALRRLALLGGALLLLMGAFRAVFVLRYAHPEVWRDHLGDLPAAFAAGLLHDLRIVLLLLLPPMLALLWLRAGTRAGWERWLRAAFWWSFGAIAALIAILVSDFVFYAFFHTHLSVLAWGAVEDDFPKVVIGAWKNHPVPVYALLVIAAAWALGKSLARFWSPASLLRGAGAAAGRADARFNAQLTLHVAATVALLSWSFSPSTGRLDAELPASGFVRQVPPNGVETLAAAVWTRLAEQPLSVAERYAYAGDRERALRDFAGAALRDDPSRPALEALPPQHMEPHPRLERSPHVVLVVMESFATHLLRWQGPDCDLLGPLARHWERGWVFPRFLPSDNGSAGSILSLIVNLPYRPGTKHLSHPELPPRSYPTSAALAFRRRGYEPRFFYGGSLDWRNLGAFVPRQGFVETAGQGEILAELGLRAEDAAGVWGVWDEALFAAVERRLRDAAAPQFLVLFTTTNHPPHELPADVRLPELHPPEELLARIGQPDPLQRKQMRTYQYACHEFGRFLDRLQETGLLDRTVVAATGDHTIGMDMPFSSREVVLERAVPFFLLAPPELAAQFQPDLRTPGSHKDVIPTLLHLSGGGLLEHRGIGESLLDPSTAAYGYNPSGLLIGRDAVLLEFETGFGALEWCGSGVEVRPCAERPEHRDLRRRHRAGMALTDWIVCETPAGAGKP